MLPAISFVSVAFIGQLIVSEVIAVILLPWLWSTRNRPGLPRWLVILLGGWLLGQIVTDLVVTSSFADYSRGWAAIIFTATDCAAIVVLASTPLSVRLFAFGLATGGILGYFINPDIYASIDPWKFGFGIPVGLVVAAMLSGEFGDRHRWLQCLAFLLFGSLCLVLDFRSLGGVAILTAGYLALSAPGGRPKESRRNPRARAALGLVFLSITTVFILQAYDTAAAEGLLGVDAQSKYLAESGAFGVLVGGRSEILVSTQAIIDSPVIGHGSWAKDFSYVGLQASLLSSLGYEIGAGSSDVGLIPAHSYLTQSWVWAGVLGGIFWFAILALAIRLLAVLYIIHTALAPLLAFSTLLLVWNIAFSPYGSNQRILVAFAVALCLVGLRLARPNSLAEGLHLTRGGAASYRGVLPSLEVDHRFHSRDHSRSKS